MQRFRPVLMFLIGFVGVHWSLAAQRTFTNPIRGPESADPHVLYHDGEYYYTYTTGGGVVLRRAARLPEVGHAPGVTVWSMADSPIQSDVWAPELHHLDGRFYIYASGNTMGSPRKGIQQMFVLEADTDDPLGSYTFRGLLCPGTPAIDESVLTHPDGSKYLVWSQWAPEQSLYIAPLLDPLTVGTPRVKLSSPTLDWERHGWPVNEGPTILQRAGKTFIVYSASGCSTEDYCLGQLTNTDGNYLDPASWIKSPQPIFKKSATAGVYGVGHNCFVPSPDGQELWNVYHGMSDPQGGNANRSTRMQKIGWHDDGTPDLGEPAAAGINIDYPAETQK